MKTEKTEIRIDQSMKICILGNYSGRLDEGMGNVTYNLFERLRQKSQ